MGQKRITDKQIATELKPDAYLLVTQQEVGEDGAAHEVLRRFPVNSLLDDSGEITAIALTIAADGTATIVNTFENGETETISITPDESGNPVSMTYNGSVIPITYTEESSA